MAGKQKMLNHLKNNWHWWLLAIIVVFSFFLRIYKFNDLLLVRADQIRDANYALEALENGPSHLRLLGPRMGDTVYVDNEKKGDEFHLGPIYYYFQYFSALFFSSAELWVFAVPDLVLSTLAVILFYLLLRNFFRKFISLATTCVFAFSFVLIQYSRFAWNTNQLIFWELLLALSLVRLKLEQDEKKRAIWLVVLFASLSIISQLHLISLFGFSVLAILFWTTIRPRLPHVKYWLFGVMAALLIYAPFITSEVVNKGDNTKRFVANFQLESEQKPILKKIENAIEREGEFYSMALTSFHDKEVKYIELLGIIFFVSSTLIILLLLTLPNLRRKLCVRKKLLLKLIIIWTFAFVGLYVKLSEELERPRYFLSVAPLPFLLLGLAFSWINGLKHRMLKHAPIFIIVMLLISMNIYAFAYYIRSLDLGFEQEWPFRDARMRPYRELIVQSHIKQALDYMALNSEESICYSFTSIQNKSSIEYLGHIHYPQKKYFEFDQNENTYQCDYFLLDEQENEFPKEYRKYFDEIGFRQFGSIVVRHLNPSMKISGDHEELIEEGDDSPKKSKAMKWSDVFAK